MPILLKFDMVYVIGIWLFPHSLTWERAFLTSCTTLWSIPLPGLFPSFFFCFFMLFVGWGLSLGHVLEKCHNFKHFLNWNSPEGQQQVSKFNSMKFIHFQLNGEIILAAVYFRTTAVTEDLTVTLLFCLEVFHLVFSSQVYHLKRCTYFFTRRMVRKSHPSWSNPPNNSRSREITHLFSWNLLQPLAASFFGPCCVTTLLLVRDRSCTRTHTHTHTNL
jgi:hypothetical protein